MHNAHDNGVIALSIHRLSGMRMHCLVVLATLQIALIVSAAPAVHVLIAFVVSVAYPDTACAYCSQLLRAHGCYGSQYSGVRASSRTGFESI